MQKRFITAIFAVIFVCALLVQSVFAVEADVNLVSGLGYTIATGEPITKSFGEYTLGEEVFNVDQGLLTDATVASPDKDSSAWFKAYSGKSRIITFDLGNNCRISQISAGFLSYGDFDIHAPRYINVSFSDNGTDYEGIDSYITNVASDNSIPNRYDADIYLQMPYSARYVRIEYSVDYFCYCDEIAVMGSKTLSGDEKNVSPDKKVAPLGGYLGSAAGYCDIVKLYNGYYPEDLSVGVLTEYEILPYVAYINSAGEIGGKMFDAMILSPCDAAYPSGGKLNAQKGEIGGNMSDWEMYFKNTFALGQDIDAINKTVGKVNLELNVDDKMGIFLALPYPAVSQLPFGDINGDGIDEYCITLEERSGILQWYINKYINAFAEKNYANLTLAGFYWIRDRIDYLDSNHEIQLIQAVSAYINDKGYELIYTPQYLSYGFDCWKELGFGGAAMQANLLENGKNPEMLAEFAHSTYFNKLGAVIRTADFDKYNSQDNSYRDFGYLYESYLHYGSKNGYISGLNIYEQGKGPGAFYEFCYSDKNTPKGIYLRRLYDLTYRYIKGNYSNLPPVLEIDTKVELIFGETQAILDLSVSDADSYWENIKIDFPSQPQHGNVVISEDKKTLTYNANSDYVGEDAFTVCVNDGFSSSKAITVNVSVIKPVVPDESADVGISVSPPPSNPQIETPLWLVILLVFLALAMVLVAMVTIFKPNKQE